jgi:hypothetical protein
MRRPASMTTVANSADDILPRFRMVNTKKMDVYNADAEAWSAEGPGPLLSTIPPGGAFERNSFVADVVRRDYPNDRDVDLITRDAAVPTSMSATTLVMTGATEFIGSLGPVSAWCDAVVTLHAM